MKNIIIILLILSALGFGGYFIYQKSQPDYSYQPSGQTVTPPTPGSSLKLAPITPQPVPAVANPDVTANWKTYTNEKYGFSFKYPSYLSAKEDNSVKSFETGGMYDQVILRPSCSGSDKSCYSIVIQGGVKSADQLDISGRGKFVMGGVSGFAYREEEPPVFLSISGFVEKNSVWYATRFEATGDSKIAENNFNQILSTFRFTK